MSLKIDYGFYKENAKFVELISFIVFNNSIGEEYCIYWTS